MTKFQQERAYCAASGQKTLAKLKFAERMKYSRKPSKIPVKPTVVWKIKTSVIE